MNYVVNDNLECKWKDEILSISCLPNTDKVVHTLSKRKLLGYLSELHTIDEFHILLLNNLSRLTRIVNYVGESGITLTLDKGQTITVDIPESVVQDILIWSVVKQH